MLTPSSNGFSPPSRDGWDAVVRRILQLDSRVGMARSAAAADAAALASRLDALEARVQSIEDRLTAAAIP